ncbi:MAG: PpiC-type peptidyl-prolyl cis-trans isomerase [Candidatus Woesebacteria bacterium GW2011_GWB1_41_10]|uniref:PpiC-type peptidyl-prolyl cis-trans isomerase n=1 Tax=Candidatus Woesebacteria bacterium GW2011_GWB1_41_10 TaxID=1618577 RepID=A0A0G0WI68_9BACT|nr:MAG: PpiC-type peptidyl-prolyl cis-trans isomerase [Candidatus Woesebacteria bacterium GW2011_GWB1_41_10]
MATKRKTKVIKVIKTQEVEEWWGTKQKIASLALLVVLFWYRTDSWPVVALVNNYPISRFELNQLMYKRVGQEALENLVVDKLIVQELAAKGVNVSDEEVNKKIEEIKTQIGSAESFEQALAIQGMLPPGKNNCVGQSSSWTKYISTIEIHCRGTARIEV